MIPAAPVLLTLTSLTVLVGVTLLRWAIGKRYWENHAQGARGYLKDVSWGIAELLPLVVVGVVLKALVPNEGQGAIPPQVWALLGLGYVSLFIMPRIGPFAAARKRLMDCRMMQIEKEAA